MTTLCLTVALQVAMTSVISPPMIRGTIARVTRINGHDVYTTGAGDHPEAMRTFGGGKLRLLRQDIQGEAKADILYCGDGFSGNSTALLRWQLIDNQYYCVNYHTESPLHRHGNVRVVPLAAIKLVNAALKDADSVDRRWEFETLIDHKPSLSPVGMAIRWGEDSLTNRRIFFDFWCRGDKLYEVYVTEPHKGNRLTRGDFHPERKLRSDQDPKLQWETVGEWTFDWTGPFYVAAVADDRYFVTDTGRVYVAPRGAKPGTALKEVWKGPPVEALIHDSDAKKFYAFTKDQYFEIADPIKPKPHTIAIRRSWTANPALETAAKCARVIRGLPEPKGK